jgi:hypothetical protein
VINRRLQISIALLLGIIATGAEWDLAQLFAWCRMTATYSRTMPLATAVKLTFGGEMCGICRMVAAAKQREQNRSQAPGAKIDAKILLFFQEAPRVVVRTPCPVGRFGVDSFATAEERPAPPVPPPRFCAA